MKHRDRLAIVAVIVAIQLLAGSAAWRYVSAGNPSVPPTPQQGEAKQSSELEVRQTALGQAAAWSSSAVLVNEVSWLAWPDQANAAATTIPSQGWTTFVFASGGQRFTVVIDRGTGFILGQHLKSYSVDATGSVNPSKLTITAETALAAAELLGGSAYREACPADRNRTKAGLSNDATAGGPVWVVTYADSHTSDKPDIVVVLNGTTGDVLSKSISNPPCKTG